MTHTLIEWSRPDYYCGETWEGWLIGPVAHTRDSRLIDETNWEYQWNQLKDLAEIQVPGLVATGGMWNRETANSVQIVHESHWACGWVEWLAIHPSNARAVEAAQGLKERLDDYPLLDEDAFYEAEWEYMHDHWNKWCDLRERCELCVQFGMPFVAGRHNLDKLNELYGDTRGLEDYLRAGAA